jgi:hypothetical protein
MVHNLWYWSLGIVQWSFLEYVMCRAWAGGVVSFATNAEVGTPILLMLPLLLPLCCCCCCCCCVAGTPILMLRLLLRLLLLLLCVCGRYAYSPCCLSCCLFCCLSCCCCVCVPGVVVHATDRCNAQVQVTLLWRRLLQVLADPKLLALNAFWVLATPV